jgi:Flp pilus assembly secretin CpaC
MWNRAAIYRVLFILLVLAMYVSSLVYNYSERERRSLKLQEEVQDSDQVHVSVRIVEANPTASEVTARLSFRLSGKIAKEPAHPSGDANDQTVANFPLAVGNAHQPNYQFGCFPTGRLHLWLRRNAIEKPHCVQTCSGVELFV